jgi:TRAP-type C4-dicarboxylate transport system substrate-binding protein
MNVPLYTTTFAFVFNKAKYEQMSAKQKKVIDNHCTSEWAAKVAGPWAKFEHDGIAKIKAQPGQDVYDISPAQLAEWQKASEPLVKKWADGAKKAGVDADAALKELKADLKAENAAY